MPSLNSIKQESRSLTPTQARTLYNLPSWSSGYFDINHQGRLMATLPADSADPGVNPGVDLYALATDLAEQGLSLPVLVRFNHILRHRVNQLCATMDAAIDAAGFQGRYTAVYPIKVNQQRVVVEEILQAGGARVGLEAGSKPELLAVLAMAGEDGLIVCNGYKDAEYVRLALSGEVLGSRVYLVIEKPSELEWILREARRLNIRPRLGLRVRLASIGKGKWQNTGGEKAKFGLSAIQVQALVAELDTQGMLDCLNMLHFHMGSQIADIGDIQRGILEAGRFYGELRRLGADIQVVDVGGGLGVDYEGTRSRGFCSMNYSLAEYAQAIVGGLAQSCRQQNLPHPDIITEAGRAMTAHHAVLMVNVIDVEQAPDGQAIVEPLGHEPLLQALWRLYQAADTGDPATYTAADQHLHEAQTLFSQGQFTLAQRAQAEHLYFAVCARLQAQLDTTHAPPELLESLHEKLADKYFCNFSVFQSVPDVWAFNQIFPIVPLHRLDERPTRRAILQDLTCDSDGQVRAYVTQDRIEASLPAHEYRAGEPYLLGLFLVGAYQEILGDMHNLFGDTHAVNVTVLPDGGYTMDEVEQGDTVDELLRYVHFDPRRLMNIYRSRIVRAALEPAAKAELIQILQSGLSGYTYLEHHQPIRAVHLSVK